MAAGGGSGSQWMRYRFLISRPSAPLINRNHDNHLPAGLGRCPAAAACSPAALGYRITPHTDPPLAGPGANLAGHRYPAGLLTIHSPEVGGGVITPPPLWHP